MRPQKKYDKILVDIGTRLAELRLEQGYGTIKEFTSKYDLPEIQYWRMEKGKANITFKSLMKILTIHKVSIQEFFCLLPEDEKSR